MMLQLVTDAVISKGYGGAPAFHSSEDGRMLSFKIGCKVYDKRADKETRWVNFNVNAFDDLAERVRRMNLKEGSHINVMGNFDMKPWVNRETGSGLSEGTNLLNGQQALAYARIRKLDADGDFSRTNRQRKVITALLDAYRDTSLPAALSLLEQILPLITTDMTDREILGYAVSLFPLMAGGEVVSQHIPAAGTYASRNIDGMAVLVADLEANRKVLKDTLGG